MKKGRLEAFSDGVIAIIITIMVLEIKVPHGQEWADLLHLLPIFFSYVLSFIYLGIYWNNHHHMLHTVTHVTGGTLWANLHLLFWLSLIPFASGWVGEHHFAPLPMAVYGVVLLMSAIAYYMLQSIIIKNEGRHSLLAQAVGKDWKGKLSPVLYLLAIGAAWLNAWVSGGLYIFAALIWLIPDRRIEHVVKETEGE
jgi:uncharacterized membrane protein